MSVVGVKIVRQGDLRKIRQFGGNDFGQGGDDASPRRRERARPTSKLPAHFRKFQIRLAGDDVVGELDDFLPFGFVADLRAAEDDFDFRADALDGGDDFGGLRDVPDINAEADDFRIPREQCFPRCRADAG